MVEAVARWTTSAAIAARVREVRVSGRGPGPADIGPAVTRLCWSTPASPSLDRDLGTSALESLAQVIVVRSGPGPSFPSGRSGGGGRAARRLRSGRAARGPGVALPEDRTRRPGCPPVIDDSDCPLCGWAQLFTVCGPGGSGRPTMAVALAQGLSVLTPATGDGVLLADLARRADQAMLHYAPDLGPGVQELVEAHRLSRPDPDEVRRTTFDVPRRGYRLLLGSAPPRGVGGPPASGHRCHDRGDSSGLSGRGRRRHRGRGGRA